MGVTYNYAPAGRLHSLVAVGMLCNSQTARLDTTALKVFCTRQILHSTQEALDSILHLLIVLRDGVILTCGEENVFDGIQSVLKAADCCITIRKAQDGAAIVWQSGFCNRRELSRAAFRATLLWKDIRLEVRFGISVLSRQLRFLSGTIVLSSIIGLLDVLTRLTFSCLSWHILYQLLVNV